MVNKKTVLPRLLLGAGTVSYLHLQNTWLKKTDYRVPVENLEPENEGMKIVMVSDLHLPVHKVNLDKLVEKVRKEQPDFIFLTGDQIDTKQPFDVEVTRQLYRQLADIAPTFAVEGNHDRHSPLREQAKVLYRETGIVFLEDEAHSVIANGRKPVVIMGAADRRQMLQQVTGDLLRKITIRPDWEGQTRLLLAHHPEYFEKYQADQSKAPDVTFSGHAHGGQVRVPKVGGLYAPGQGKMPQHTAGVFAYRANPARKLVVSRGIGKARFPFRINNRPELVVVTLLQQKAPLIIKE